MKLRPVRFQWKDHPEQGEKLGLIAQEVQATIPEAVDEGNDERKTLGIYYADLMPVLIKATQDQQAIIVSQQERIDSQQKSLEKQQREIDVLKKQQAQITELLVRINPPVDSNTVQLSHRRKSDKQTP